MRMSLLAYVTFGLLAVFSVIAIIGNPSTRNMLMIIPMLLALAAIPMLLTEMNRRAMARVDTSDARKYRISDLVSLQVGEAVRVQGEVAKISFKWMNRPHIELTDGVATTKVILFSSPREDIRVGDHVEAVGALAKLFSKHKSIWGVTVHKIPKYARKKRK